MEDYYHLETPENVELSYTPAGLGSRFLAAAIDTIILVLLMLVLVVIAVVLFSATDRFGRAGTNLIIALVLLGLFAAFFGYYTFWEMLWNGQSPGKRVVGLRVIRDDGLPLNFSASMIRNLIRFFDLLPGSYGLGILTMLFNKRWKRLGDLAAGTLVVRDVNWTPPDQLRLTSEMAAAAGGDHPRLTAREYELVREYLLRTHTLTDDARLRIEQTLVPLVESRTGIRKGTESGYEYLRSIAAANLR